MNTGIYKITNLINGKIYIGKSVDIKTRWSNHLSKLFYNKHENEYLQNSYNKHGKDAFKFEIVVYCEESFLEYYENKLITLFESHNRNIGYNLTTGDSDNTSHYTEEVRQKLSDNNWMKTEEGKQWASIRVWSKERNEKIAKSRTGKKHSEETRKKMSESQKLRRAS